MIHSGAICGSLCPGRSGSPRQLWCVKGRAPFVVTLLMEKMLPYPEPSGFSINGMALLQVISNKMKVGRGPTEGICLRSY